jgi:HPt (histidine-containing phosphotransfer) domain-containing protein
MSEGGVNSSEAIDRAVLSSLRELQEEGEPDIVAEIGGIFLKHSPEKIDAIEKAAENGDAKGLQIAAHSLKSSSAYVGAMRLSTMSKELEQMGRSQEMEGSKEKARLLKEEYLRAQALLKTEIESGSTKAPN